MAKCYVGILTPFVQVNSLDSISAILEVRGQGQSESSIECTRWWYLRAKSSSLMRVPLSPCPRQIFFSIISFLFWATHEEPRKTIAEVTVAATTPVKTRMGGEEDQKSRSALDLLR